MRGIVRIVFFMIGALKKVMNRVSKYFIKKYLISKCGKNVKIGRNIVATYSNLEIGDNSSIGENTYILNTDAKVIIKNNVMIAPNVVLVTGNHRTDIVGRYMSDVEKNEKLQENDENIIIEEDVWIGTNVIILKGVKVGKGSIVGAGSILCQDIEPFSIVVGEKAKKIRNRFSKEKLEEHKNLLKIN